MSMRTLPALRCQAADEEAQPASLATFTIALGQKCFLEMEKAVHQGEESERRKKTLSPWRYSHTRKGAAIQGLTHLGEVCGNLSHCSHGCVLTSDGPLCIYPKGLRQMEKHVMIVHHLLIVDAGFLSCSQSSFLGMTYTWIERFMYLQEQTFLLFDNFQDI